MVFAAVVMASGVGVVWERREGVGVAAVLSVAAVLLAVAVVVLGVAAAPAVLVSAGAGWVVLVGVAVLLLVAVFAAGAFVLAPSSALPASLVAASTCACCPTVVWGRIASAMAAMGIVAQTMDVHASAQSR